MFRALVTIGGAQLITMLVMVIRTKILAVMLGAEAVGVMAVIDKLLNLIAQTASLSLPLAAIRFLPARWAAGPGEFRDLFARMRNVVLAVILATTAGALLVCSVRPSLWGQALLPYGNALVVAMLGLPVIALVPFVRNALAARLAQNDSMLLGFAHAIVLTVAAVGVWWQGLAGYYAVYALLGTVMVIVATRWTVRDSSPSSAAVSSARGQTSLHLPAAIWRFAGALLMLAFLMPYAALFVHYRLLSDHGAQAAGWMQAAFGIALSVRAVLGTANAVFLTPNVNRGGSPQARMDWADRFQGTFCVVAGLSVPPLLLFPELAIRILYSGDFLPAAQFVMVFVMVEILILVTGIYGSLVLALDHMRFHVANNVAAQLLVVATAWYLVGPLGILGAGIAGFAGAAFLCVSTLVFLRRAHGLRVPARLATRIGWLALALIVAGAAGRWPLESVAESIALKVAVYGVIAVGFACLLTHAERIGIREAISARMTGRGSK